MTNKDSSCQCLDEIIHQVFYRKYLVNHLYYLNTLEHKHIIHHSPNILEYMLDIM